MPRSPGDERGGPDERPMNEESSVGEDLRRGRNFFSAKRQRFRRIPGNYALKSALAREGFLLDDSERFGLSPGLPL